MTIYNGLILMVMDTEIILLQQTSRTNAPTKQGQLGVMANPAAQMRTMMVLQIQMMDFPKMPHSGQILMEIY